MPSTPRLGPEAVRCLKNYSLLSLAVLPLSEKPKKPTFEEWSTTADREEILRLLTKRFEEQQDPCYQTAGYSNEQLTNFDRIFAALGGGSLATGRPEGTVSTSTIIAHLAESNPECSGSILAAEPSIDRLLRAAAAYPFTAGETDKLSRSSLIRAVALLTPRDTAILGTRTSAGKLGWSGGPDRSLDQLRFIFSALSNHFPRRASDAGILRVLSKVHYPKVFDRKVKGYNDEPLESLLPISERLSREEDCVRIWDHKVATIEDNLGPFIDMVVRINSIEAPECGSNTLGVALESGRWVMPWKGFAEWAVQARLTRAFDTLFRPLCAS